MYATAATQMYTLSLMPACEKCQLYQSSCLQYF
jgi:hypothetical protein